MPLFTYEKLNLETKVNDLPLGKCRKITLINTICSENGKSYKSLTIADLCRFSVIDGELFHNKGYFTKVPNVGKVRSSEIAPYITLSKALKIKDRA